MEIVIWDGADAFGVPADTWRTSYPTEGHLLFVVEDGRLVQVVASAPGGGRVPITDENLAAISEEVLADLVPASTPPKLPNIEERLDGLQEQIDDVTAMLLEG